MRKLCYIILMTALLIPALSFAGDYRTKTVCIGTYCYEDWESIYERDEREKREEYRRLLDQIERDRPYYERQLLLQQIQQIINPDDGTPIHKHYR